MQIKLTNQQILTLEQAISALDGKHEPRIVDGRPIMVDGKPLQVFRGFLISAAARWSLARNASLLSMAVTAFHRAKSALIRQHTGGEGAISPANGNFNAFAKDYEQLAGEIVELDLQPINLADLKMEENERAGNEFPIAVLNALQWLIVEGNVG